MEDRRQTTDDETGSNGSVGRRPPAALVFDSAIISDFYALTAEVEFDDLMVHLIEPGDLLPEERGGREAEDRHV